VNDYLTIGDSSSLDITNAITVSLWMKPSKSLNNYQRLIEKNASSSWYLGYTNTAEDITAYINNASRATTSGDVITLNQWNFVTFTYDMNAGGTNEVGLYINGILKSTGITPQQLEQTAIL